MLPRLTLENGNVPNLSGGPNNKRKYGISTKGWQLKIRKALGFRPTSYTEEKDLGMDIE